MEDRSSNKHIEYEKKKERVRESGGLDMSLLGLLQVSYLRLFIFLVVPVGTLQGCMHGRIRSPPRSPQIYQSNQGTTV